MLRRTPTRLELTLDDIMTEFDVVKWDRWWTDAARSSTEPPHVARVFSTTPLRTLGMR